MYTEYFKSYNLGPRGTCLWDHRLPTTSPQMWILLLLNILPYMWISEGVPLTSFNLGSGAFQPASYKDNYITMAFSFSRGSVLCIRHWRKKSYIELLSLTLKWSLKTLQPPVQMKCKADRNFRSKNTSLFRLGNQILCTIIDSI